MVKEPEKAGREVIDCDAVLTLGKERWREGGRKEKGDHSLQYNFKKVPQSPVRIFHQRRLMSSRTWFALVPLPSSVINWEQPVGSTASAGIW